MNDDTDLIEPDVYVTLTPFGRVNALFDAAGAGVRLEGPDDAVASVDRVIRAATNAIGMSMSPETVEPADYFNFCQPKGSGIMILEPVDVALAPTVPLEDLDEAQATEVMDGGALPLMIRVMSGGKQIGTMTPEEFRKAAKVPSSMFLEAAIKQFNAWKEEQGEPERVETFLVKGKAPAGRSVRLDAVVDIPGLRAQVAGAAGALAKLALARAIVAAREEEPAGLTPEEQRAVATTIWQQLGGKRFAVMTGAKDPLALGESSGAPLGGLRFSLPTGFSQKDGKSTGINRVFIRLNSSDTYDIEFGGARGRSYTIRATAEDVYADNLREVFTRYTGLDTSLGSGGPFATRTVSRKEARDAYEALSYAITDLQGHTDMELARAGSTDRIERAVEAARRLEAGWPKDELQPRGLIEKAEGLIDRARELRSEGGLTEISMGDVKSFYLQGSTLTDEQKAAILAKPSRVTMSGSIEVPRFNKAEVERMVAEFEAANKAASAAGPRFRYALVNRPADFATLPKGLTYTVEPRPAAGQPHHDMARHGVLVTERELTPEELKAFELAPLIDGDLLDQLAQRIAEGMREYAASWVEQAGEDAAGFRDTVLQAVNSSDSGIRYSVGDPDALVGRVLELLKSMASAEPAPAPGPEPAPTGMEDGQRAADMALLEQIAAGTHPRMLEPELADEIEAALARHPDDAEVAAAVDRAVNAYANGLIAATS